MFSARKSRVTRRETAFYAVSVHREACYCLQHAAFWHGVNSNDLIKQVRTPPGQPADGVAGWFYESFVPGEDCCELGQRQGPLRH